MIVPRAPRAIASMAMWFVQTSSESQFARASLPSTLTPRASRASYSIALPSPTYAIGPVSPPEGVGGTPPWLAASNVHVRPPAVTAREAPRNRHMSVGTSSIPASSSPICRIRSTMYVAVARSSGVPAVRKPIGDEPIWVMSSMIDRMYAASSLAAIASPGNLGPAADAGKRTTDANTSTTMLPMTVARTRVPPNPPLAGCVPRIVVRPKNVVPGHVRLPTPQASWRTFLSAGTLGDSGETMGDAVIVGAVRTPIGRRGGSLKDWRPDDLAAYALRALLDRTGVAAKDVEDVVMGCVTQIDEQGLNIGRIAPLVAGFPETVPGTSVNRMCASGLQAFNNAAMEVMTGQNDLVIAAGVESMSRVPIGSDGGALSPTLLEKYEIVPQGISPDLLP